MSLSPSFPIPVTEYSRHNSWWDFLSSVSALRLQQAQDGSEGTLSALLLLPPLLWPLAHAPDASLSSPALPQSSAQAFDEEPRERVDSFWVGLPGILNYKARSYSALKNLVVISWFLFIPSAVGFFFFLWLLCQKRKQPWISTPPKGIILDFNAIF